MHFNNLNAVVLLLCLVAGVPAVAQSEAQAAVNQLQPGAVVKPATAADLQALANRLDRSPTIDGRFVQYHWLAELPRPLQSSGDWQWQRGRGLDWRVKQPFINNIELTAEYMIQRQPGFPDQRIDSQNQPGFAVVASVFLALFEIDLSQLQQHFQLQLQMPEQGDWRLTLIPQQAAFAQIAEIIVVHGDRLAKRIELREANGERIEIQLLPKRIVEQGPNNPPNTDSPALASKPKT